MSKIFITIDNSNDELPQVEWARLHRDVDFAIRWGGPTVWGAWVSETTAPVQSACWCAELEPHQVERLRRVLPLIAREYQRNTIGWAVAATTEFIDPAPEVDDGTGAHHLPAGTSRSVDLTGDGSAAALPPAVEGCICSHTVHMEVPGAPVELNVDAGCPIHGGFEAWPLSVSCPACGAPERVWCFKEGAGHSIGHIHYERGQAAVPALRPILAAAEALGPASGTREVDRG